MKATKISLMAALIAGVLVAYTPASYAQDAQKPEGRPGAAGGQRGEMAKERLDKMTEELKLTADQKTKVETALKEQQEKMRGARDSTTTPEERREKMQAGREELNKKMKGILDAEQFAKWEKMQPARGQGGPGRPEVRAENKKSGTTAE